MSKDREAEIFGRLLRNYFETRRNKRYGADQMAFEADWVGGLVRFMRNVIGRTFRFDTNYAFLTSIPRWREIFATYFEGRMFDHLLCDPLKPVMELELSDRTYNNREGKGSMAAINRVIEDVYEETEGYTKPVRIIKLDISGYFPNARWDVMESEMLKVIRAHRDRIDKINGKGFSNFLEWACMICLQSNPARHCTLKSPKRLWYENVARHKSLFPKDEGIGAPIGRLSSQHAMGLYINDLIVRWLNEDCGIRTVVFVDDVTMIVPEERHQYALSLIGEIRKRLASVGLKLNEKKFYDQQYWNGLELLGSHIRPMRIHVNNSTYSRAETRIAEYNEVKDKEACLDNLIASVNSYTGILKNRTDYKRMIRFVGMLDDEWKSMLTWDKRRLCVVAKEGYKRRDILFKLYNIRRRKHSINNLIFEDYDRSGEAGAA